MSTARERLAKLKERSAQCIQQITQQLQENNNSRKEAHTTAVGATAELPPAGKQKEYEIKGRRYRTFGKVLGTGGSSKVYQALDDEDRTVAIKRVNLKGLHRFVREAYENEVQLLCSLQGSPFVIKLYAYEQKDDYLFVVLEKGEKDLHKFLVEEHMTIDAKFIKYYWQELLKCVNYIHQKSNEHNRIKVVRLCFFLEIVHSDLKPANFLFVGAKLKLIDFGIASEIPQDSTSIIKDTQFGTISYMSPEALSGEQNRFKISEKSDVWSLGCILYAMFYMKTPFQDIQNQMARMKAITSDTYVIQYPPCDDALLLDVMKKRASVEELLAHDYLSDYETIADDKLQEALEELNKYTPRTKFQKFKKLLSGTKVSRP
ncbi:TTK protein kinase [Aphelenchoides avenae]|nr:TTK protein kinase [Aphelenchus avenae]